MATVPVIMRACAETPIEAAFAVSDTLAHNALNRLLPYITPKGVMLQVDFSAKTAHHPNRRVHEVSRRSTCVYPCPADADYAVIPERHPPDSLTP
jgi:hypothetical protein